MKNKTNLFTAILFLAGLSVLVYPYISNLWNDHRQKELIVTYKESILEEDIELQAEWEKAFQFNADLLPMILPDSFADAELEEARLAEIDPDYMQCLNVNGDGIMGMVEIPKINIQLPIYHTTRAEFLEKGAGHLHGSSLPVGGTNTHAVISAHRGLPSASMFTDLDKMEEGDHFLLYVLDDILCYEVDQIAVVEPEDTEKLNVIEGEDHVTLLTCTPYGVNSHRLLVRGKRVPYVPEAVAKEENTASFSIYTNYLAWIFGGVSLTVLLAVFLIFREKADRQRRLERELLKLYEGRKKKT